MLLLFYFLCLKFSIAPQCAFIFMYVSIYFHHNTTLPPKFPCKSSTLCLPQECAGVRFFHIKLLQPSKPPPTATCFFFMLYILIWWRHDLSSLALYSWNHKRQQQKICNWQRKTVILPTSHRKLLRIFIFSYKCSLTQFSFSFQIYFVVLKRTDWLIFLWNYTMVCILFLLHSIIPFEII